jgi:hypothetical protein
MSHRIPLGAVAILLACGGAPTRSPIAAPPKLPPPSAVEVDALIDIATDSTNPLDPRIVFVDPVMGPTPIVQDSAAFIAFWTQPIRMDSTRSLPGRLANPELLAQFWTANRQAAQLAASPFSIPLMPRGALTPAGNVGFVLQFSRLGFNQHGDSALLSISLGCRGLCGRGEFWLLTKQANHWRRTLLIGSRDY